MLVYQDGQWMKMRISENGTWGVVDYKELFLEWLVQCLSKDGADVLRPCLHDGTANLDRFELRDGSVLRITVENIQAGREIDHLTGQPVAREQGMNCLGT